MTTTDLILQWGLAALVALVLRARGQLTLFAPAALHLVFHVVVFCLRPTLVQLLGLHATWEAILPTPEPGPLRTALWVSSAGLVAFTVACLVTGRRTPPDDFGPAELDAGDERAIFVTAAIAAVPGLTGIALGLTTSPHSGYAIDLQVMLLPATLLVALATGWRWWSLLPFLAAAAARTWTGGGASAVFTAGFALLLAWLWTHRRRQPSAVFLLAAGAIGLAALLGLDPRTAVAEWIVGREAPGAAGPATPGLTARLDRPGWAHFETLAGIVAVVPEKTGEFTHGRQHLAPLRAVVSDPRTASEPVIELGRHGRFRGLPVALVSDGWMSGGWAGVALTLGLAGALLGLASGLFARRHDDPATACFFFSVLALAPACIAAGSSALVHQTLYAAAVMETCRFLSRRFRRVAAAAEERIRLREERQRRRLLGTALLNPNAAELTPDAIAGVDRSEVPDLEPHESAAAAEADSVAEAPAPEPAPDAPPASRPRARWHENGPG